MNNCSMHQDILAMLQEDNTIKIPQSLYAFRGHFVGNPIVPGIYSLELAVHLVSRILKHEVTLHKVIRCKFMKPLTPGMELASKIQLLSTENNEQKAKVQFLIDDTVTVDIHFIVIGTTKKLC
ncbi:hypothetical protein [Candidatus Uabimicrobium sp. HlEnr_7]|uniref:hypothetical protein n=1 Tax=Candidatus Uabimicrobium helgolandensis TaxID=3095367 RepID=UPI00355851A0